MPHYYIKGKIVESEMQFYSGDEIALANGIYDLNGLPFGQFIDELVYEYMEDNNYKSSDYFSIPTPEQPFINKVYSDKLVDYILEPLHDFLEENGITGSPSQFCYYKPELRSFSLEEDASAIPFVFFVNRAKVLDLETYRKNKQEGEEHNEDN